MADYSELASNATKEIILKLMEGTSLNDFDKNEMPKGTNMADHIGNCFQALYKKIYTALNE